MLVNSASHVQCVCKRRNGRRPRPIKLEGQIGGFAIRCISATGAEQYVR
jgi:hypothetical protein